ncbi:hypothetical protein SLEP1_g2965 [Rubroshorea leprosula]|uniref:Uncharacterized protein n=1 Tax=Rubroshorea leprosula TaxID=152421 RepID=A0AAV5HN74_9ROSI|nr:hypothetical protein SLEP1_g2965 [Rubroshorea leprosula]
MTGKNEGSDELEDFVVSDCGMISSEFCAFVRSSHKCTASTMSLDFGFGA